MLKGKLLSLVAASLVVLSLTSPQHYFVYAQEASCAATTEQGSSDEANSCASDDGVNSSADFHQKYRRLPKGDGEDSDAQLMDEEEEEEEDDDDEKLLEDSCQDKHEKCPDWSARGECSANPNYMTIYCRRSCGVCPTLAGEKDVNLDKVTQNTTDAYLRGADFGEPQKLKEHLGFSALESDILKKINETREYVKSLDTNLIDLCKNKNESCTTWAISGECTKNPGYMKVQCGPACKTCDQLLIETRCPIDPDAVPAWQPGDLDAMFGRLIDEPFVSEYDVQVLSRDPWVVTIDGIITDEEMDRLIELGSIEGYQRSSDVGAKQPDGSYSSHVSEGRTSTNAWCQNACYEDPIALRVIQRLSNVTGINETNSEYLQLLRYEEGQFYRVHHDYIRHNVERQQGVRILTVFLYLSDVEAGGGTNFDKLNITVMPKRGRALFWPSVLNSDPNKKDGRTTHQALSVDSGIKYAANAWFHQFDFKTPNKNGCTA